MAVITCYSFGEEVKWYYNETEHIPLLGQWNQRVIKMSPMAKEYQGYYECLGTNNENEKFLARSLLMTTGGYKCVIRCL